MFVKIVGRQAHMFGTCAEFNRISRSLRKCTIGAAVHLPLEHGQSEYTSLQLICSAKTCSFSVKDDAFVVAFTQNLRRPLLACFSMPSDTQPGSTFWFSKVQTEGLDRLADASLDLVIHVAHLHAG